MSAATIRTGARQGRGDPARRIRPPADPVVLHVLSATESAGARWRLTEESMRLQRALVRHAIALHGLYRRIAL